MERFELFPGGRCVRTVTRSPAANAASVNSGLRDKSASPAPTRRTSIAPRPGSVVTKPIRHGLRVVIHAVEKLRRMEFRAFLVARAQKLSKVTPLPVALEICRKGSRAARAGP